MDLDQWQKRKEINTVILFLSIEEKENNQRFFPLYISRVIFHKDVELIHSKTKNKVK